MSRALAVPFDLLLTASFDYENSTVCQPQILSKERYLAGVEILPHRTYFSETSWAAELHLRGL